VVLRRALERTIRAGHPWLYAEAVKPPAGLQAGEVDVVDGGGRFVARGLYDPDSPIAVRLWTTAPAERVDGALVGARVKVAAAYRAAVIDRAETDAFRLLHGEGDRLPGIVCDVYGDTAVVRLDTPAVEPLVDAVVDSVRAAEPGLRRVLLRSADRTELARGEGVVALVGALPEAPLHIREYGTLSEVDMLRGHKTGAYLDQRENRRMIRRLAAGRRVLDVFSYTGGFAVSAALGGATEVTCVDVSQPALDTAERNFALNGLDPAAPAWRFVSGDAFEVLVAERSTFDLVILDPPSMASSAESVDGALAAYRRLNELAMARLAPNSLLLTASCSSHITEAHLVAVVRDAAASAQRPARILEHRGAGPDHPTLPAFPEGRYLSALLIGVD
jgi:23S rRNA (cytosine1962-C5)-methyltransferase